MQMGVEGFVQSMMEIGFETTLEAGLAIYRMLAIDGACAGIPVETGVSIEELETWPQVPPHWLHFPADIRFSRTNSQTSSKQGWLMHSRQITGWGDAPAGIAWVSHVRAVLSERVA